MQVTLEKGITFSQGNRKLTADVFPLSTLSVAGVVNPSFLIGDLSGVSQHSPSEAIKKPVRHHRYVYHLLRD